MGAAAAVAVAAAAVVVEVVADVGVAAAFVAHAEAALRAPDLGTQSLLLPVKR